MSDDTKDDNESSKFSYHKDNNKHEMHDLSPDQAAAELKGYIDHLQTHDLKKVEFALMVVGHEGSTTENGGHVCSLIGGHPKHIAKAILDVMDELITSEPASAVHFLLHLMERMGGQAIAIPLGGRSRPPDLAKFDALGGEDAKNAVQDILASFKNPEDRTKH